MVIITHQNLSLVMCWKLFWATLSKFCTYLRKLNLQGVKRFQMISDILSSECKERRDLCFNLGSQRRLMFWKKHYISSRFSSYVTLNELLHRLDILKSLASIFQFHPPSSLLILSILNHPCSFMAYYYLFSVFLS